MLEHEIRQNAFLMGYAQMLLGEIDGGRFVEQPLPGVNHPAWILGHLILSGDGANKMLGLDSALSEQWEQKFGMGSTLTSRREDYPSKDELMGQLDATYERLRHAVGEASEETLNRPNPSEQLRPQMPALADLIGFLMTGHLAVHFGQLSAWRRMIGLPPMF